MSWNPKHFMYLNLWSNPPIKQFFTSYFFLKANNFFFNLLGMTWAQMTGEGLQNQ